MLRSAHTLREVHVVAEIVSTPSLTGRMIRASRLETRLYNEVEADVSVTTQALTVVILTAVASGIGAAVAGAIGSQGTGSVGGLIGGVLSELLGWAVWSYVMYIVGTRLFGGTASYGELLRTLGFDYSPGVLLILRFIPVLGGLIAAVGLSAAALTGGLR